MDWAKTTARRDEKQLGFGIWCALYERFGGAWGYFRPVYVPYFTIALRVGDKTLRFLGTYAAERIALFPGSSKIRRQRFSIGDAGWISCHTRHQLTALSLWNHFISLLSFRINTRDFMGRTRGHEMLEIYL